MARTPSLWDKIKAKVKELQREYKQLEPLLQAKEKADQISGLFDQVTTTADTGRLTSTNEDVNKLYAVGAKLSNHLGVFARQPPSYWLEHSGANLFSHADTTEALKRLVTVREELDGVRSAAEALSALTKLLTANDYADIKGVAGSLTTATIADIEARKETWRTFDLSAQHVDRIRANVVIAIDVVRDLQDGLHTFIVQKKNNRRLQDTLSRHSPFYKPGAVDALNVNPWKRPARQP
jgi:hypothetical protein